MRIHIVLLVVGELLFENVKATSGGDETDERRGRVEWSRAELRVRLETDKVRVI